MVGTDLYTNPIYRQMMSQVLQGSQGGPQYPAQAGINALATALQAYGTKKYGQQLQAQGDARSADQARAMGNLLGPSDNSTWDAGPATDYQGQPAQLAVSPKVGASMGERLQATGNPDVMNSVGQQYAAALLGQQARVKTPEEMAQDVQLKAAPGPAPQQSVGMTPEAEAQALRMKQDEAAAALKNAKELKQTQGAPPQPTAGMTPEAFAQQEKLTRDRALATAGETGWQLYTDPTNNTQYRGNARTGEYVDLQGKPYQPGGAQKIGGGAVARSPAAAIMQKYMAENPNASPEDLMKVGGQIRERISAADRFGSGPLGTQVRRFSVSASHLDTLEQLGAALKNGNVPVINSLANSFSAQTGGAAPNNFDLAKTVVGDEITSAIIAGVGSVTDRTALQDRFKTASSPDQLLGVIQTAKKLIGGQLNGMRRQFKTSTGLGDDEFDAMLSPEAKAFGQIDPGQGAPAQAAPAAQVPTATGPNGQKLYLRNGQWSPQ